MDSVEDNKLVEAFLAGNEIAFNKIVNKYSRKIYWHARGMLNNHLDADEVTQEVLIVMYNKLKTFKFESSLYTWIYKITSTRTLNLIREKKIKKLFSIHDEEYRDLKDGSDIEHNFEKREEIERVEEALKMVPLKQKEVFILKNFEELSYKEISEITGKSIGGLKANYFHALKKVSEFLENDK